MDTNQALRDPSCIRDLETGEIYIAGWKVAEVLGYKNSYTVTSLKDLRKYVKVFPINGTRGERAVNCIKATAVLDYLKSIRKNDNIDNYINDLEEELKLLNNVYDKEKMETDINSHKIIDNSKIIETLLERNINLQNTVDRYEHSELPQKKNKILELEYEVKTLKSQYEDLLNKEITKSNILHKMELMATEMSNCFSAFQRASIWKRIGFALGNNIYEKRNLQDSTHSLYVGLFNKILIALESKGKQADYKTVYSIEQEMKEFYKQLDQDLSKRFLDAAN